MMIILYSWFMPFEWSIPNINQTSIVHEEITIQKSFGSLLVPGYTLDVNGYTLPQRAITVDDFSEITRTIHVMINQNDLRDIHEKQIMQQNMMNFSIKPAPSEFMMGGITANGMFKVLLGWDVELNSDVTFVFDVIDLSQNDTVQVNYDVTINDDGTKEIFRTSGNSNEFTASLPKDTSEIITINFLNINGNKLGKVTFPVVVNMKHDSYSDIHDGTYDNIRNNAKLWSEGELSNKQYLLDVKWIISKEEMTDISLYDDGMVPDWFKNNAGWWNLGMISDEEYISGLEFLILE